MRKTWIHGGNGKRKYNTKHIKVKYQLNYNITVVDPNYWDITVIFTIMLQKVSHNSALDRLTDTSKYGGSHKERFTPDGKGKGKEGRVDVGPVGFRGEKKTNSRS